MGLAIHASGCNRQEKEDFDIVSGKSSVKPIYEKASIKNPGSFYY